MNIAEAVAAMRAGKKVRRRCHVATTVAKCWLDIAVEEVSAGEIDGEGEEVRAPTEIIYFHAGSITASDNWVGVYPEVRNPWKPSQADVLADDFVLMD